MFKNYLKILTSILITMGMMACQSAPSNQKLNTSVSDPTTAKSALPNHYKEIQFPEFNYQPPNPEDYRFEIQPGVVAYLYPSKQLPMISLNMIFKEQNLPPDTLDVAALSLLSSMYISGGSTRLNPAQVDDSLEFLSANLSASLGDHSSDIALNVMSKDFSPMMHLLKDLVLNPGLDSARLELRKDRYIQAIQHRYDQPKPVLDDLYTYTTYQSHPSNWKATVAEVKAVNVSRLKKMAENRFRSDTVIIGVSGDFEQAEMVQFLKNYMGGFKRHSSDLVKKQNFPDFISQPGIYLTPKPGLTQSSIKISQPFVQRPHPDYYATSIASYILGAGGFTSRLTSRIRSDEGLAYSVNSFASSNYYRPVTTGVQLQTKVESATRAIQLVFEEIEKMIAEGITEEELQKAKEGLTASLPSLFDTPEATVSAFVLSEAWGREMDHFRTYRQKIMELKSEDVMRALKIYFNPAKMSICLIGPEEALLKTDEKYGIQLSDFGPIKIIPENNLVLREARKLP
jgi:zinc protease